ncbi:MAG: SCO family protein [Solirubrobacteraceae bacterium]
MRPKPRILLLAVASVLVIGLALALLLDGGSGGSPTHSVALDGAAFPPGLQAHDFTLQGQGGHSVSLSDFRGQVVVLGFLFSDCRTCVLVAQQVRGALDELETEPHTNTSDGASAIPGVRTIFVSTDPHADTPVSVRRFLNETSLSGRVEYLTGTSAQLRPVWHDYGIPPVSTGRTDSEAGITVLLIDRNGIERVGFGVEQITAESLAHDIRLLRAG